MQLKKEEECEFKANGGKVYLFFKRFFDITLSLLGLICLSPALIIVAIAIKL